MRSAENRVAAALALVAALAMTAGAQAADEEGFEPLLKGDDPSQFQLVNIGPETISIEDGVIRLTGRPNGYFATKDSHENYILRFDWMYERPEDLADDAEFNGNSGLLVHITGEPKVWPQCVEVQLMNKDAGHIFAINGSEFTSTIDDSQRKAQQLNAIKPVGQWNTEEVICEGDSIVCLINSIEIDRGKGASPSRGPIGWQSEGRPIRFRNLRIKKLD